MAHGNLHEIIGSIPNRICSAAQIDTIYILHIAKCGKQIGISCTGRCFGFKNRFQTYDILRYSRFGSRMVVVNIVGYPVFNFFHLIEIVIRACAYLVRHTFKL